MTKRLKGVCVLFALAVIVGGCAAGQAFRRGDEAMKNGDLDQAVAAFREAVQADPDNPRHKISLERAMQAASRFHLDLRPPVLNSRSSSKPALGDVSWRPSMTRATGALPEKWPRSRRRCATGSRQRRPKPRQPAAARTCACGSTEPALNPASREPLVINFVNTNFKDILTFVGNYAGINVS